MQKTRKKYLQQIKKPHKLVWSQLMYLYLLHDKFWIFESSIFFLSKKINYTSWIHIFSKKMASKTRFNSTHQSLLTTWHVSWIEFLLNLQYFFFRRKLISCSFKIEIVLWIFIESSFGRICKLISYYKRVVNEKKSSCFKLLNSLKRWNDNKLKWAVGI